MRMPLMRTTPTMDIEEEERLIIQAVLQGDHIDFQILVRRYHKPIYSLMIRMIKDVMTAEDLTQETFARAYEKLRSFKTRKRFFPWLYSIGINLCKDHLRRQGIRDHIFSDKSDSGQWPDPDGQNCLKNADCVLEVEQVALALGKLPLQYSEPMLLYYREGLTVSEIADALNISSATAKVRIHRGREKLKQMLGADHE
jgi:RNA polymerase sigma-70 factor, ECF subfamily